MDRQIERELRAVALEARMDGFYSGPIHLEAMEDTSNFGLDRLVQIAITRIHHRASMILTPGTVVTPVLYLPAPLDGESVLAFVFGTNDDSFLEAGVWAEQDADLAIVAVYDDTDKDLTSPHLRVNLMLSESHKQQIPFHFLPRNTFVNELAQRDKLFCRACGGEGLVLMRGTLVAFHDILDSRKDAAAVGCRIGDSFSLYFACPHCHALADATGVQFRNFHGVMVVRDL